MARPRKDNPRDQRVLMYLSKEEVEFLEARALEVNLTRGQLVSDILGNLIFGGFAPFYAYRTMLKYQDVREKNGFDSYRILNPFDNPPYFRSEKLKYDAKEIGNEEALKIMKETKQTLHPPFILLKGEVECPECGATNTVVVLSGKTEYGEFDLQPSPTKLPANLLSEIRTHHTDFKLYETEDVYSNFCCNCNYVFSEDDLLGVGSPFGINYDDPEIETIKLNYEESFEVDWYTEHQSLELFELFKPYKD